jgi:hypothetical protein
LDGNCSGGVAQYLGSQTARLPRKVMELVMGHSVLSFFLSPKGYLVFNFSVFLSPRQPDTAPTPTPTPTPKYARYVDHVQQTATAATAKGSFKGRLPASLIHGGSSVRVRFGFGESCKRALKRYIWDTRTHVSARVSLRRCSPPVHQAVEEGLQVLRVHVRS